MDEGGRITFLDFDATGHDYLMQDVKNFTWGNLFYDFPPVYGESVRARIRSRVRPFTAAELEHSELFLLAKTFRLIAGMAHASISVWAGGRCGFAIWTGSALTSAPAPIMRGSRGT